MYILYTTNGLYYGKGTPTANINKAVKFQKRKEAKDNASVELKKNKIKWKIREV